MNVTVEFSSESVIIIWVREKTRCCFSKTVFRLRAWAETIPVCVRRKTRSSRKQVSLRLYFQLIDTWHAVHSSHHRRSGPDGGKLTGGFSSFTITFAGLAVPRLSHSRLERTHNKDHSIAYKPSKTEQKYTSMNLWIIHIEGLVTLLASYAFSLDKLLWVRHTSWPWMLMKTAQAGWQKHKWEKREEH